MCQLDGVVCLHAFLCNKRFQSGHNLDCDVLDCDVLDAQQLGDGVFDYENSELLFGMASMPHAISLRPGALEHVIKDAVSKSVSEHGSNCASNFQVLCIIDEVAVNNLKAVLARPLKKETSVSSCLQGQRWS